MRWRKPSARSRSHRDRSASFRSGSEPAQTPISGLQPLFGTGYPVDPTRFASQLPYPRPRDELLRYRTEVMAPGEDFDQTGFEVPPAPKAPVEATGQGKLFDDDCSQPDSADGEPVFWTGGAEQAGPANDFVQADALKSV